MRSLVVLMVMIIAIFVVARADTTAQESRPTFTSQAELVVLHVTVKDRRGAYVTDLSKDAFEDVPDVLRHIAEEIRHTYTVGFVPPDLGQDGAFHRLRVEVRAADRRSLTVRTREGYRASLARTRSQ